MGPWIQALRRDILQLVRGINFRRLVLGSFSVWVVTSVVATSCKPSSSIDAVEERTAGQGGAPLAGGRGGAATSGTAGGAGRVGSSTGGSSTTAGTSAISAGAGGRAPGSGGESANHAGSANGGSSAAGAPVLAGGAGGAAGEAGANDGAGSSGGPSCLASENGELVPDPSGWMDGDCNDVGVQGNWYPFGDQYLVGYGDARCVTVGQHLPAECTSITTPDPHVFGFPNVGGRMHTAGVPTTILPCPSGLTTTGCPDHDYLHMGGAGIGFDLNGDKAPPARATWDPTAQGVVGIQFTIDVVPTQGMRVEFPMLLLDAEGAADTPPLPAGSATDQHTTGNPYFGAQKNGDRKYPASPVVEGVNRVLWSDISPPSLAAYTFDPKRLLGVRFHLPSSSPSAPPYDFTISKLTFLRQ